MSKEFKATLCRVICMPFCLIRRFFQFSIRCVEGIREIPDLMASELLVAFMTIKIKGVRAMTQKNRHTRPRRTR